LYIKGLTCNVYVLLLPTFAQGETGVDSSHPSHISNCGFHFMHVRGEMKVDAASHSISQHHAIAGKPKLVGVPHCNFKLAYSKM
jgi:hypothetical protein